MGALAVTDRVWEPGEMGDPCPNYSCGRVVVYYGCPVHGHLIGGAPGCTCQYGPHTPRWYGSVAVCPVHKDTHRPELAPAWALENAAEDRAGAT